MGDVVSLQGPVEKIGGKLVLRIPLSAGGEELIQCSRGISEIEDDFLKIVIPDWLAAKLAISEGSLVQVDNREGKFNMTRCEVRPN